MLTEPQIERYARHVLLREVGGVGQERLLAARVAVLGLGPAGGWAAAYLALAGIGRLDLLDARAVAPDDLVPLLDPAELGRPRAGALAHAIPAYNPDVEARAIEALVPGAPVILTELALVRFAAAAGEAVAGPVPGAAVGQVTAPASVEPWPVVLAFAAGDAAIVGPWDGAGPCATCVAGTIGDGPPTPAAALVAGSLAATAVLAWLGAGAAPATGFLAAAGGNLRRLDAGAIGCPHRGRRL